MLKDDEKKLELPLLIGDEVRLKQVLINLTKNAIKFTPKGSVKIKAAYNDEQGVLEVKITDTGVGIAKED